MSKAIVPYSHKKKLLFQADVKTRIYQAWTYCVAKLYLKKSSYAATFVIFSEKTEENVHSHLQLMLFQ